MTDRAPVDIRAELERLAAQRRALMDTDHVDHTRGLPVHVAPPSGRGGDIVENRE